MNLFSGGSYPANNLALTIDSTKIRKMNYMNIRVQSSCDCVKCTDYYIYTKMFESFAMFLTLKINFVLTVDKKHG